MDSRNYLLSPLLLLTIFIATSNCLSPSRISRFPLKYNSHVPSGYSFKTLYFDEQIDHFGFANTNTFKLRYLLADQFWNRNGGPIFFYTGNEGDIEMFCNNTGFMWDIAPEFHAMLVFAEHRYYGLSLPFGKESYKNASTLNYLTSEQALADFAELIKYMKSTIPGAAKSPVVAFGGSYGGMLSSWLRIKYPNVVVGALAGSAPIWQFTGLTPCQAFYDTASATWLKASPQCVSNIHQSYQTLEQTAKQEFTMKILLLALLATVVSTLYKSLAAAAPVWDLSGVSSCDAFLRHVSDVFNSTQTSSLCVNNIARGWDDIDSTAAGKAGGLQSISSTFNLCTPLKSNDDLSSFKYFLVSTYINYAMVDYPYPANFIANLPGWPVKVACSFLSKPMVGQELLTALAKVTNLYYNYTGNVKCLDWNSGNNSPGGLGYEGWDYQSCTEMVMPMCANNSGMFYDIPWDFQAVSDSCYQQFKVRPRKDWIKLEYWGKALKSASNIIFSNGLLDPWSTGGVLQSISDTVVAIQIQNGAHHLDLRAKNKLDPPSVTNARIQEKNIIRNWLHLTQ